MTAKEKANSKLHEYLKLRESAIGRKNRQYEINAIVDKLNKYLDTYDEMIYCLQTSIDNGWLWVFPENTSGVDLDDLSRENLI